VREKKKKFYPQIQGVTRARSAIIHRTVRCAPDMPDEPAKQRSLRVNGWLQKWTIMNSARQKSDQRSQRSSDCPVQLQDKGSNGQLALNPNGLADVARTRQSTVSVRCAHRQQKLPTARKWLEAINTPNHLIHWHPSILKFLFNTRAKPTTQRHILSIQSSPSSKINSIT
jgi:hypothetical protein